MSLPESAVQHPNIPAAFESRVRAHPARLAVQTMEAGCTYAELNRAANRLANRLQTERQGGLEPIALLFEHGAQAISSILGVLKAGHFYVPLHPHHNAETLRAILADSTAGLLVTNRLNLDLAARILPPGCSVLCLEDLPPDLPVADLELPLEMDHPGAIFYTSGSTGKPKGVLRSHLNLASNYTVTGRIGPDDRLSHLFSNSFGAAAAHLFGALLGGATLYPFDVKSAGFEELAAWLRASRITFLHPPVSVLRGLITGLPTGARFEHIRQVTLGGAALYRADIARFWEIFPEDCLLLHEMALTETGVLAMNAIRFDTEIEEERIPPGTVVPGKEVWIADEDGERLPPGETGEIVVRSELLALGYWGEPERTAAAFRADPDHPRLRTYFTGDLGRLDGSGRLEHDGRLDSRVKIRGFPVDLVEVEDALRALPEVRDAVVLAQETPQREQRLAAYLVPAGPTGISPAGVRAALMQELSDYQVPAAYCVLEAFPLTGNGKVDRRRLPPLLGLRPGWLPEPVPPRGETEEKLVQLWSGLLDVEPVGSRDDFFDLGGHSLAAGRLLSAVRERFEVEIPLQTIYENPVLADLAAAIDNDEKGGRPLEPGPPLEKLLKYLEGF